MASEIALQDIASAGLTVYFRLRNSSQQIWDTTGTPAFENYDAGDIANYGIAMAEQGASGYFVGDLPTLPAGIYHITAHVRAGGSPAQSDEEIASGSIHWDGSRIVLPLGAVTHGRTLAVDASGQVTVGSIATDAISDAAMSAAAIAKIFGTALTEAYRTAGQTGTVAQILYEILARFCRFGISNTTITTKKLDGTTTAKTYTLDSATAPTSSSEAS